MNKHQKNMLNFANKYPGWHAYAKDRLTVETLCSLVNIRALIINEYGQFKGNNESKRIMEAYPEHKTTMINPYTRD